MHTTGAQAIANANAAKLSKLLKRVIHPEYESSLGLVRTDIKTCGFADVANATTDEELIALLDSLGYDYDASEDIVMQK